MLVLEEGLLQPYSVGILVSLGGGALLALSVADPTTYRSLLPSSLGQSRLDVAHAGGRFRYRLYSFMDAGGNLGQVAVVVPPVLPIRDDSREEAVGKRRWFSARVRFCIPAWPWHCQRRESHGLSGA